MCSKEEAIKEILASKMLEYVGYDHACYDLAYINGMYGVLTRDFKKDYCNYISGDELIYQYCDTIDKDVNKENLDYERFNNLSDIWDMLEAKYLYHPNKDAIIKEIMYKLAEKFMFDILIDQWDGASYNWMIEETDTYATLAPLYDHQKMLGNDNELNELGDKNKRNIKVEEFSKEREKYDKKEEIRKYLNYSSDYFKEEFENLMRSLTPNNIKWLLITIESELGYKIDSKIKNSIVSGYDYNYNQLQNILNEELNIKK
jgi:hypothetical protein